MADLLLKQLDLLARPAPADLQQPVDDGVQIHVVFRHFWRPLFLVVMFSDLVTASVNNAHRAHLYLVKIGKDAR